MTSDQRPAIKRKSLRAESDELLTKRTSTSAEFTLRHNQSHLSPFHAAQIGSDSDLLPTTASHHARSGYASKTHYQMASAGPAGESGPTTFMYGNVLCRPWRRTHQPADERRRSPNPLNRAVGRAPIPELGDPTCYVLRFAFLKIHTCRLLALLSAVSAVSDPFLVTHGVRNCCDPTSVHLKCQNSR